MEQIHQRFEYRREICWSFALYLIKLSLKLIGRKEQEPETELSVKHLKLSIAHFKLLLQPFWYRLKPAL